MIWVKIFKLYLGFDMNELGFFEKLVWVSIICLYLVVILVKL
jgi:hypothetical protein